MTNETRRQIWVKKSKHWFKNCACLGFAIFFVSGVWGCASTHKTTTTETTITTFPSTDQGQEVHYNRGYIVGHPDETVVEKSETTTTTATEAERPGLISSTFHAIGYVIALPFIIIGGLFRIVFGG